MTGLTKATPHWTRKGSIVYADGWYVCDCNRAEDDAALIVRAVNCHDDLGEALVEAGQHIVSDPDYAKKVINAALAKAGAA